MDSLRIGLICLRKGDGKRIKYAIRSLDKDTDEIVILKYPKIRAPKGKTITLTYEEFQQEYTPFPVDVKRIPDIGTSWTCNANWPSLFKVINHIKNDNGQVVEVRIRYIGLDQMPSERVPIESFNMLYSPI